MLRRMMSMGLAGFALLALSGLLPPAPFAHAAEPLLGGPAAALAANTAHLARVSGPPVPAAERPVVW